MPSLSRMAPAKVTTRRANGAAIRAIREALGHPHGKFAVSCGISPGYLTNIEKGVKDPSPQVLTRIAEQLGVDKAAIIYVPVPLERRAS